MDYREQIKAYQPDGKVEEEEKRLFLQYIALFPDTILTRENTLLHMTSSAFILTPKQDKILMVHHNIYNTWAWTGGHADGEADLLAVATREAKEETGITSLKALSDEIASLDILTVQGHWKNGSYVAPHLHLSAAYLFEAQEEEERRFQHREGENTGMQWILAEKIATYSKEAHIIPIYQKLLRKAARYYKQGNK